MRLGGPIFKKYNNPHEWVAAVQSYGYRAAYCPVGLDADDATISAYAQAAAEADTARSFASALPSWGR
jgi:hypothetical protein